MLFKKTKTLLTSKFEFPRNYLYKKGQANWANIGKMPIRKKRKKSNDTQTEKLLVNCHLSEDEQIKSNLNMKPLNKFCQRK